MTDSFGVILEALSAYWTSAVPLIILALCGGSMATLTALGVARHVKTPRTRNSGSAF